MSDSSAGWWTTPRWIALALSAASFGALVLGGVIDMHSGILAFTLIAVIWYTCFTYESVEAARESIRTTRELAAEELRQQRIGLANGVLAELKGLDVMLRAVEAHGARGAREDDLGHPVVETSLGRLELFRPATAELLVRFVTSIRRVARLLHQSAVSVNPAAGPEAQKEARVAVDILCDLAPALVSEGGHMPEDRAAPAAGLLRPSPVGEHELREASRRKYAEDDGPTEAR